MADMFYTSQYIAGGRYKLIKSLGKGAFGEVYLAENIVNGDNVAVKIELQNVGLPALLNHEKHLYTTLNAGSGFGIPNARSYGQGRGHEYLVLDLLGPSLDDLFHKCSCRFSLKTVLMLADQMITLVEHVHKRDYIYRDIKPNNMLMGVGEKSGKLYLVDFGLAKRYRNARTHEHIDYHEGTGACGTPRYMSINAHNNEQSRRDDLEAIGYVLVYFLKGSLPWQAIETMHLPQLMTRDLIYLMKRKTSVAQLCEGLEGEFATYLNYCLSLDFKEEPNYEYLRGLFRQLFKWHKFNQDNVFDWTIVKDATPAAVVAANRNPPPSLGNKVPESPVPPHNSIDEMSTLFGHLHLFSTKVDAKATDAPDDTYIVRIHTIDLVSSGTSSASDLSRIALVGSETNTIIPVKSVGEPSLEEGNALHGGVKKEVVDENGNLVDWQHYINRYGRVIRRPTRLIEEI